MHNIKVNGILIAYSVDVYFWRDEHEGKPFCKQSISTAFGISYRTPRSKNHSGITLLAFPGLQ